MKTQCPHCQKVLSVPDYYQGKQIKCVSCRRTLVAKPMTKTLNHKPNGQSVPLHSNRNLWILAIAIAFILMWVIDFFLGVFLLFTVCVVYWRWQWNKKVKHLQGQLSKMRSIYANARKGEITKSAADKFFDLADKSVDMMSVKGEKDMVGTKTVASLRDEIQNMSNQISLILVLRTPTASLGEDVDKLAALRQQGMISDSEFQTFSERFKLTTGEKARSIIKAISELYLQHQKGAMSEGNFHAALWSLLDKLDRKT